MRPRSVFAAATLLATVAVMSSAVVVAQTSKEWSQCTGGEGPIADVIISGCSVVIQAGQDNPRRLATAFNNRGVAHKFKGEYDRALEDAPGPFAGALEGVIGDEAAGEIRLLATDEGVVV